MCQLVRVNYKLNQLRMCESESFTSLTVQKWVSRHKYHPDFRSTMLFYVIKIELLRCTRVNKMGEL